MLVVLAALLVMREQIPRLTERATRMAAAAPVPQASPAKP
jgi:AAHS family 4-hydroxybenzoate transporter-like MFS transporter